MAYILPILLMVLVPFLVTAQTDAQQTYIIKGRVVSALTGNPIPYCNITYKRANKTLGASTDTLGNFTLQNLTAGSYRFSFYAIEYSHLKDTTMALVDQDMINQVWSVETICVAVNKDSALTDIRANRMKLFLQSGDPPIVRRKKDSRFSKKYHVTFHDFADLISHSHDCLVAYNQTIFKYLDQRYGHKWRINFRPDVPGYK